MMVVVIVKHYIEICGCQRMENQEPTTKTASVGLASVRTE